MAGTVRYPRSRSPVLSAYAVLSSSVVSALSVEPGVAASGRSDTAEPPSPVQSSRVTPVPAARIWTVSVDAPVP